MNQENNQNNLNNQNVQNDTIKQKEKYLDEYMGPKAPIFKNGGFSFATFFFGWVYLFYRKMYKLGSILLALNLIASTILMFLVSEYTFYMIEFVLLFAQFILGAMFGRLYVKHATNFIDQRINENLSEEEIINACRIKGGVDYKAFLLLIIVGVFNAFIANISTSILKSQDLVVHFHQDLQGDLASRNEYNYKQDGHNYYKMEFNYDDGESDCSFTLNKTDKYKVSKNDNTNQVYNDFIRDFHTLSVETEPQNFNNITLYTYEDTENNTYYYLYGSRLNMSEIVVEINNDSNGKCSLYKDYILNNLKIGK